jgi:hypothetical protein
MKATNGRQINSGNRAAQRQPRSGRPKFESGTFTQVMRSMPATMQQVDGWLPGWQSFQPASLTLDAFHPPEEKPHERAEKY